jgi:hypothetical protein
LRATRRAVLLGPRNVYSLTETALRFRLAAGILKQRYLALEPGRIPLGAAGSSHSLLLQLRLLLIYRRWTSSTVSNASVAF